MDTPDVISEDQYYVVNKDTPAYMAGAILRRRAGYSSYSVISNIWNTDARDKSSSSGTDATIVENSPDWYRRVYLVGGKFVNQDQAITEVAALVQDGPEA